MEQQIQTNKEIVQIKKDIINLKEAIENISILLNKGLLKELREESRNIEKGEYLTEEEFKGNHNLN